MGLDKENFPQNPQHLQIQPTQKCNLDCRFCHQRQISDLPIEAWREAIEDICEIGFERVSITGGGDPLLRPSLLTEIVEKTKASGMSGDIVTNGTIVTSEFAETLVDNAWDFIGFSIHGSNAKTSDYLRGVEGAFKKSIDNARLIDELKREKGAEKPFLNFNVTVTKQNYKELEEIVRLAKKTGFTSITCRLVEDDGHGNNRDMFLTPEDEFRSHIRGAESLAGDFGIGFITQFELEDIPDFYGWGDKESQSSDNDIRSNTQSRDEREEESFCHNPFFSMVIFANGEVAPCCTFDGEEDVEDKLYNISNYGIEEIWEDKFTYFREMMLSGENLPEICKKCPPAMRHAEEDLWEKFVL